MSSNLKIFLRNEMCENEIRTPLIPADVKILINNNIIVFVESSQYRIYADELYEKEGAIITIDKWYDKKYNNCIIIGIKELNYLEKLNKHTHLYFSHSYKKQQNSGIILNAFIISHSKLYDFEYFLNNKKKRIIAFGYFAGLVGAVLGLKQFYNKINMLNDIKDLKPWLTFNELIEFIKIEASYFKNKINDIKIVIVGGSGRCGKGIQFILDNLNIKYIVVDRESEKDMKMEIDFDILFNCILLNKDYNRTWFNSNTQFNKPKVIVDISCDYTKINNPIKLYNKATSWKEPIFKYNKFLDIIAIENLPSLLPYESSIDFSKKCTELLLQYDSNVWNNNLLEFYNATYFI